MKTRSIVAMTVVIASLAFLTVSYSGFSRTSTNTTREMPEQQQVSDLVSKQAIQELELKFAHSLDTKNWDLAGKLFTDEVVADFSAYGIPAKTMKKDDLIGLFKYSFRNEKLVTEHLYTNFFIEVNGKTATCRFNFIGNHFVKGLEGGDDFYLYAQYNDKLKQTENGWKISERTLTVFNTKGNATMLR
jgi:SnoaL-like domain